LPHGLTSTHSYQVTTDLLKREEGGEAPRKRRGATGPVLHFFVVARRAAVRGRKRGEKGDKKKERGRGCFFLCAPFSVSRKEKEGKKGKGRNISRGRRRKTRKKKKKGPLAIPSLPS